MNNNNNCWVYSSLYTFYKTVYLLTQEPMDLQNSVTSIIVHAPIFLIPLKFSDPHEKVCNENTKNPS